MPYAKSLNKEIEEMWAVVLSQHKKALAALIEFDKDLAREVVLIEEIVNSCEQFIESDCEYYFSVKGSGQITISLAMFALKITRQLEIIGDLASKIANDVLVIDSVYPHQLLTVANIDEIFRSSNKVLELTGQAFEEANISLAQVVMSRIEICAEMISESNHLLVDYLTGFPHHLPHGLSLFSILENIKRTVEISQSLSQGIINQRATVLI